jgi:flavorubredoxin
MPADATIAEVAPDVFRICVYEPGLDMQFNHFLVRDDAPLLFHTGYRRAFPALREAVGKLIDPTALRYVAWSHFESDECGALNDWLRVAPHAEPVCGFVGKVVNVDDFAIRPARGMTKDDVIDTGRRRFRYITSPHLPHGWDAGVMFEEADRTLFCSDLFHHFGDVPAVTDRDVVGRVRDAMHKMQSGPLAGYMPYTCHTEPLLRGLAELRPRTLAVMHGSSYTGDGAKALCDLAGLVRDAFHVTV